ncbi:chemotaxis protein [Pseudoxanthomonas kalamensis DSM 18571]|uniref:chemotaxis protein CheB n=1 Tax=Pseudoxanthomonas kalamensis TaxID=289483 RepID=UPI0013919C83|nr:chemotaxis protein CheB [Pseudoxanthomonas kalamensis]KAF1709312.1 chemotaxis protein [Pseudoxanthomonas kalamensis DSM 18571]
MSANEVSAKRVILLAREGKARDKLQQALSGAGISPVLQAAPEAIDLEVLRAAAPEAVLVALEPAVEDGLEALDAVLSDPSITVIYDDAELAASREGWAVQRWARHLAAKLSGHGDVLPPGGESDAQQALEPGRPQTPSQRHEGAELAPYLQEARGNADDLPRGAFATEPKAAPAVQAPKWELSLEEVPDEAPDEPAAPLPPPLPPELPAVEAVAETPAPAQTGSGGLALELESLEGESSAAATVRGAVLLSAGIGGPDAVRKLLAELPSDFPLPVLLQMRLDGGRYDNLIKQLERVSDMPVLLAVAGETAKPGHVYVLPEVGVQAKDGVIGFREGPSSTAELIAALPAEHSALLLLSGSETGGVEAAVELKSRGALVAGQATQGCYDPAASRALAARGGELGSPVELATRLIEYCYG